MRSFHVDANARDVWHRELPGGWDNGSDVCTVGARCGRHGCSNSLWSGVSCNNRGRVATFSFWTGGRAELKFTLGDHLGDLAELSEIDLPGVGLSGTIPASIGKLQKLRKLWLYRTRLSGTLPKELWRVASMEDLDLAYTRISGTLSERVAGMPSVWSLYLSSTRLSGSLPEALGQLSALRIVHMELSRVSGSIPATVAHMQSLETLDIHVARLSGRVPSLLNCLNLRTLRLSNNSLTGLPRTLPQSLTHLYLDDNPIDADAEELSNLTATLPQLHALSISFVNIPMVLEPTSDLPCVAAGEMCFGARVAAPTGCRVGATCSWRFELYDADDQRALIGSLLREEELALGLNCTCGGNTCGDDPRSSPRATLGECARSATMSDNHDGTFTATAPADWALRTGLLAVRFFHRGTEFRPVDDPADSWPDYDGLRTVNFGPIECPPGTHTIPEETGSSCVCEEGFVPDTGDNDVTSCHRSCSHGTVVTPQGDGCECSKGSYDTEAFGALLCFTGDWSDPADSATLAAVSADRAQDLQCSDCPEACAVCDSGVPTLRAGWRLNASTAAEFAALMAHGVSGRPQYAFRCPSAEFETGGCPPLGLQPVEQEEAELQSDVELAEAAMSAGRLDAAAADIEAAERLEAVVVDGLQCLGNHTGRMCAPCSAGFFLKASDDSCVSCTVPETSAASVLSVVLSGLLLTGGAAALWRNRTRIRRAKAEFSTNLKIMLGLMQVLVLLKDTLNLVFPPEPQEMLSMAAVFTADFQGLVNLECSGWSWEGRWAMSVFGLPLLGSLGVLVQYLLRLRKRDDIAQATQGAVESAFLCVMVLYPRVSTVVLSALRCRELGPELSVLDADYTVACDHGLQGLAWVMAFAWPVGIPIGLLGLLWRQWRVSREQWVESELQLTDAAESENEGGASDETEPEPPSMADFNAKRIRGTYGFCTKDFRPAAFFWEPLDMIRKLALSGLLQFVDRGTAFQVFCGCVLAFGSCAAQIKVAPYAEPASNVLKALVEAQIFVAFLISFILRVLPAIRSSEPVSAVAYGWVLVVTLSGLLVTSVGLTAHQILRRHRGRRYDSTGGEEGGEVVALELSEGLVLERGLGSSAKK